ncbi:hypothetical protein D3C86_1545070 [compost metagenome]
MGQEIGEGLGKLASRHGRALSDFDRGRVVAQAEHQDVHRGQELLKPIGHLGAVHHSGIGFSTGIITDRMRARAIEGERFSKDFLILGRFPR